MFGDVGFRSQPRYQYRRYQRSIWKRHTHQYSTEEYIFLLWCTQLASIDCQPPQTNVDLSMKLEY